MDGCGLCIRYCFFTSSRMPKITSYAFVNKMNSMFVMLHSFCVCSLTQHMCEWKCHSIVNVVVLRHDFTCVLYIVCFLGINI
jgi:hypothetical protein